MFSQTSVILSRGEVAGGMYGRMGHTWGACMAGGTRGRGLCMAGGVHGRGGMHGQGACVVGEMATAADGTHPTGMHSCFYIEFKVFRDQSCTHHNTDNNQNLFLVCRKISSI